MRRGRVFFLLALILILVLAVVAVKVLGVGQAPAGGTEVAGATPTPVVDLVNVVVTVQQVPLGGVLDETLLGMIQVPRDVVIQGWYTDIADVVGQQARFDLEAGTIISQGMLATSATELSQTASDAALVIPPNFVAISIPIDRLTSVAYGIQDGDHVNVIASFLFVDLDPSFQSILPNLTATVIGPTVGTVTDGAQTLTAQIQAGGTGSVQGRAELDTTLSQPMYVVGSEKQRPRLVTQMLLQDVPVLHVGTFELPQNQPTATPVPAGGEAAPTPIPAQPQPGATPEAPPPPPDIITLIVSPQEALVLSDMLLRGAQLNLALRAAGDTSRIESEAVTLQYIMDTYRFLAPSKLPYGTEPRIDNLVAPILSNDQNTGTQP